MIRDATFPITLIVGGFALLAWNFGWIPDWNTLIALAFVIAGAAILVFDGLTKKSIVTGPVLISLGAAWYGYFELGWRSRLIIPLLMIFAGLMMLIARFAPLADSKQHGVLAPRERNDHTFK
ncbi:MAG: hypothetical protein EAZ24_17030 [Burkholderiales bacterium]|nr:MAG: hypothetical protein EAZ24_17030 [Burkholderiales bacterium]TAG77133.1 MAG: hypothetical protein EAZ21_15415 [Betaproteobacteria bacterium]